jgi:hypothetical protein
VVSELADIFLPHGYIPFDQEDVVRDTASAP